jgi:hypothetical protein
MLSFFRANSSIQWCGQPCQSRVLPGRRFGEQAPRPRMAASSPRFQKQFHHPTAKAVPPEGEAAFVATRTASTGCRDHCSRSNDRRLLQRVRLQILQRDKFKRRRMSRFQHDGRSNVMLHRIFPARDAHAPLVAGLESGETPFRVRCHQVVSVEHRKIEEFARGLNAYRVQTEIFRAGSTITVAKKAGQGITTTTLKVGSKNIRWHAMY